MWIVDAVYFDMFSSTRLAKGPAFVLPIPELSEVE